VTAVTEFAVRKELRHEWTLQNRIVPATLLHIQTDETPLAADNAIGRAIIDGEPTEA
jgi:hypothetical protein